MRTAEDCRFIAARVTAYVRAHPSTLPLLGEAVSATCRNGHDVSGRRPGTDCAECSRDRKRRARVKGVGW